MKHFFVSKLLIWRQNWVAGVRHGNSIVACRVSPGGIISLCFFWTKYAFPSQVKSGILKLTIRRRQSSCSFFFVSCEESSYYRVVSVGQLRFDCSSYCEGSRHMQGFAPCLIKNMKFGWPAGMDSETKTTEVELGFGQTINWGIRFGQNLGWGIELPSPSADHLSTQWTCLGTLGGNVYQLFTSWWQWYNLLMIRELNFELGNEMRKVNWRTWHVRGTKSPTGSNPWPTEHWAGVLSTRPREIIWRARSFHWVHVTGVLSSDNWIIG